MNFRTELKIPPSISKISYSSVLLFTGSCFTQNIGSHAASKKLRTLINPCGIAYNPESVFNTIDTLLQNRKFTETDLFCHNSRWHSFLHHSEFSADTPAAALEKMNNSVSAGNYFLKKADFLFLTFGTSMVYEERKSGLIVSNCHKLPADNFRRYRLTPQQIVKRFNNLLIELKDLNPELNIVFTISPVRHIKDGFFENNVNKAVLFQAIDEIIQNNDNCSYFPSYEIVMDELRDYRFFKEDMLHPNDTAVKYIFEKFCTTYMNEATIKQMKQVEKISARINHKPFNPQTEQHLNFLKKTIDLIKSSCHEEGPDWSTELKILTEQLKHSKK